MNNAVKIFDTDQDPDCSFGFECFIAQTFLVNFIENFNVWSSLLVLETGFSQIQNFCQFFKETT